MADHPRNRIARNSVGAAVALAVVVAGTFVGVRALGSAPSRPAVKPTPSIDLFKPIHGWIVYQDADAGQSFGLLTAVDPAHPNNQIVLSQGGPVSYPVGWSHNGSEMLLHRFASTSKTLLVMRRDGSVTPVANAFTGSFSPDGATVLFGGDKGLYVVSSSGGRPRNRDTQTSRQSGW